jgi:beta-glucosidase
MRNLSAPIATAITALLLGSLGYSLAFAKIGNGARKVTNSTTEARIEALISQMTLDEKVSMTGGIFLPDGRTNFDTPEISRLGIPGLKMTDGPVGVRGPVATAFPSGIALAATWNPDLLKEVGAGIAREVKAIGKNVILGPCVNIARAPEGGRTFECFGEDPLLAGQLAAGYIRGVQDEHVIATVKHFALNNQETERTEIDVRADERTIQEIYLPAFKRAVRAGVWAVMASYNKLNGPHTTESPYLLDQVLRRDWGFQGLVMSDWDAVASTVPTALAGLDIEMPTPLYYSRLKEAVLKGEVPEKVIDEKCRRILRAMAEMGILDGQHPGNPADLNSPANQRIALEAAQEAIVLLKNDDAILPIDQSKIRSIAILGPSAAVARYGGGGSSIVSPFRRVSAYEGLRKSLPPSIRMEDEIGAVIAGELPIVQEEFLSVPELGVHGLKGEYFNNRLLQGAPAFTRVDPRVDFDWGEGGIHAQTPSSNFSVRWTGQLTAPPSSADPSGKARDYSLVLGCDDGCRMWVDGKLIISEWRDQGYTRFSVRYPMKAGESHDLRIEYYDSGGSARVALSWAPAEPKIADAVELAKRSDMAVVFVGLSDHFESEGFDRTTLLLAGEQERLIKEVAKANPNTVVVVQAGGPIVMTAWKDSVKAVVQAWYPGQEGGTAIADVLLGKVNPSGKLPVTIPRAQSDTPAYGNFPGINRIVNYAEGIFVGYRHYDTRNVEPGFPFGFGLSYTQFKIGAPRLKVLDARTATPKVKVEFDITNTGLMAGAETAQVYVHQRNAIVPRPDKELRAFKKVKLAPGETKTVTLTLGHSAFAYFDANKRAWTVDQDQFDVMVGTSSRDISGSSMLVLGTQKR